MKHLLLVASATMILAGSTSTAWAGSCPDELPRTLGYWKTHPDAWVVNVVAAGDNDLGKDYAIENVLKRPSRGDAVVILLHQLIPAKLNIAAGVDGAAVQSYIDDADALLTNHWIGDDLDRETRQQMIDIAAQLDDFNNGAFCFLPVELTDIDVRANGTRIELSWTTHSEQNNAGFEVQHRRGSGYGFESLSFVSGHGSTDAENRYSINLDNLGYGLHTLRLKQVDFDGTFSYSPEVEVNVALTEHFALANAYPNPFNPSTTLQFTLREAGDVELSVFDLIGRHVRTLASGYFEAGSHDVQFEAGNLPSGTYLYRLETATGPVSGTLILLK